MEDRLYYFGDKDPIHVPNGGYLAPDRIHHYEDVFGELKAVKYKGRTVVTSRNVNLC